MKNRPFFEMPEVISELSSGKVPSLSLLKGPNEDSFEKYAND